MSERMDTDRLAKIFAADFVREFLDEALAYDFGFAVAHLAIEVADLMRRAWRDGFKCAKEESDE